MNDTTDKFKLFHLLNKQIPANIKTTNKIHVDTCKHTDVIQNKHKTICVTCGKITIEMGKQDNKEWMNHGVSYNGRNSRVHVRKQKEKSIFKDVKGFNIDKDIVYTANETYNKITKDKIFRGRSRKAIIYACITYAYRIKNLQINKEKVLQLFQINKKSGLGGIRYLNMNIDESSKKQLSNKKHLSPIDIIQNVMLMFNGTQSDIKEVEEIYYKIKNKSSKINRSRPKSVANALIYYWIQMKNKNVDISFFSKKVQMSELTINKLIKEIVKIVNKI